MSKIKILFQPNSNEQFEEIKAIVELLKSVKQPSDYEYEITAINYSFNRKNKEKASYSHAIMSIGTIYYLFDNSPTDSNLAEHEILINFAKSFKTTVVKTLEQSQFKAYVSEENLNSSFFVLAHDMVERDEKEKISAWKTLETINQYKTNQTPTFFSKENDYSSKSSAEPSRLHYKPFALFCGGIVAGLIAVPLFFFEPVTACLIAFTAVLLILGAAYLYRQEREEEKTIAAILAS